MGDGSALVCGGENPNTGSRTAECYYVDSTTLALGFAPPLPEAVWGHQVYKICILIGVPLLE